jgi:hypothetical protein
MASDDSVVDDACQAICEEFAAAGLDAMFGMCVNAGQETIIGNASGDYESAAMDCAEGDAAEFSADHEDAVGEIVDVGNEFLAAAADACAELRAAADELGAAALDDIGAFL